MTPARFAAVTSRYRDLRIALLGDFCLDRYLEIDPARQETSIETGLPVHNVVHVRSQPGGAGTILNNLAALGVGRITPIGFCGDDGEGFELRRALGERPGVDPSRFLTMPLRRTFTYCKPLVVEPDKPPRELNRLDSKNWTSTPPEVEEALVAGLRAVAGRVDALVLLDQVDLPETGVVTRRVREAAAELFTDVLVLADSRRGLADFPAVGFKMNAAELRRMGSAREGEAPAEPNIDDVRRAAAELARRNRRPVFVTLAERGIVGATADGTAEHVPALPLRGPIDVVGAGDAVTANLTAALASGAALREALELAMAAASIVLHQLGTTGTATIAQLRERLLHASGERQA